MWSSYAWYRGRSNKYFAIVLVISIQWISSFTNIWSRSLAMTGFCVEVRRGFGLNFWLCGFEVLRLWMRSFHDARSWGSSRSASLGLKSRSRPEYHAESSMKSGVQRMISLPLLRSTWIRSRPSYMKSEYALLFNNDVAIFPNTGLSRRKQRHTVCGVKSNRISQF